MTTVTRRAFLGVSSGAVLGAFAARWALPTAVAQAAAQAGEVSLDPALHVLNRITWGARSDDRARFETMGHEAYIDWQLNYETIDDPVIDAYVGARRILTMPYAELTRLSEDNYDQVLDTMLAARLYRAVHSERQLYERMVEFWTDHFNIPIGDLLAEKIIDDRVVIRRYALGKFRDLLFASARSAAMLYYLDNSSSTYEHPNENYARELMELHTLGVDGGYTEQDVVEVARALTGWTVSDAFEDGFTFDLSIHDQDEKTVFGVTLPAGRGIEDGLQVIDLLATHPSTARFIAWKLCRRFVSDTPPDDLVASTAEVFTVTDGDIRLVMRHILLSDQFMAAQETKFRRPFDFLAAAARVLSPALQIEDYSALVWSLEPLGHVPYFWHPPNGYPEPAAAWINTNGLLHRWNLALNLGSAGDGFFPGAALALAALIPPQATVAALIDAASLQLVGRTLPEPDRLLLAAYLTPAADLDTPLTPDITAARLSGLVGLILASPHFSWI